MHGMECRGMFCVLSFTEKLMVQYGGVSVYYGIPSPTQGLLKLLNSSSPCPTKEINVCQKSAYFLAAQMAVLSSSFSVFIVLRMYNFDQGTTMT